MITLLYILQYYYFTHFFEDVSHKNKIDYAYEYNNISNRVKAI